MTLLGNSFLSSLSGTGGSSGDFGFSSFSSSTFVASAHEFVEVITSPITTGVL